MDSDTTKEALRQDNLIYGGLAGVGVIFVQPFIGGASLSAAARICVISFAIALPLLAALLLVNYQETFRNRASGSRLVVVTKALAMAASGTGLISGLWHVTWIAGTAMLAASVLALGVHSAGYTRLEYPDGYPDPTEPEET